jgi:hypothetical protein
MTGTLLLLLLATPVVKVGTCPVGWYTSGAYCIPSRATPSTNSRDVIQKVGTCPLGWSTQSSYCITR